ncbi:MAG: tetratricopeptide repeat protein [Opitutales bacterium]
MFHPSSTSAQTTRIFLLLTACSLSTATAQPDLDLATKKLSDIALREENIYKNLAEDPDFYSADDLERHIHSLTQSYSTYLENNPEDVEALILYGKLLRRIDHKEAAFAAFLKADDIDPEIAVVKQQIGTHLAEQGKGKAAFPFYLRAVELEPQTPDYHFALGQLLHQFREQFLNDEVFTRDALEREMLKAFRRAAELAPDNFDAQMRLGEAYYDLNSPDWKAALLHWNRLSKKTDTPLQAEILRLHRAKVMGKLGRRTEAKKLLESIDTPSLQQSRQQVLDDISQL